ncbi:MAG: DUF192 domain-containing protein [Acidimicrobiales bacterium]
MAELLVDGRAVAPLEVAATRRARGVGLLGRDALEGALWLPRTRSVHTIGMRFAIDVAACDRAGRIVAVATLAPGRLLLPRRHVRTVVEAPAGALVAWGATIGSILAVGRG